MAKEMSAGSMALRRRALGKSIKRNYMLLIMLIPSMILIVLFKYVPMYGVLMAFQKYRPATGITGSQWVGLDQFIRFFEDPYGIRALKNTFILGVETLLITFPAPIILALIINEIRNEKFKKVTQTISYMPYFISVIIIIGMLKDFCAIDGGKINEIVVSLGGKPIDFFSDPKWFRTLYIGSALWQGIGYNSIIYLAAISGINPELYESAELDGANRFQKILHITLPSIVPTVLVLLIMAVGGIMGSDFTKIILMYSANTYETADVLSTYLFRYGIEGGNYSYGAAVGLFNSIISFLFLWGANVFSRKVSGESLW